MRHFRNKSSSNTPTNSRPHTPPTPAEYIRRELATFHPREKDRRALVASSSAIALSIASASSIVADTALDEPGSSKESGWKTAYGAAKIAVETAKESSDMFPPLKAVLGALFVLVKNFDQTTANAEQIRGVEERIQSLHGVLAAPVGDRDSEEMARREALTKKLAEIVARLKPLSEQNGLVKFLNNVDNANTLNNFIQDLAYAIIDYQTSIQQNIHVSTQSVYENTRNLIEAVDLELLGRLDPVRNAGYQSGPHDSCLRGTREDVLDGILRWVKDSQERNVFWLNGLAGTGKSTIAQAFSEIVAQDGTLGASFFCSRDYLNRKELKNIFPTLAYQLACRYPALRSQIIQTIKKDPSVAHTSLISQLKLLIVDPLSSTGISCVIVVDALDECADDQPASAILSVLGRHVTHLPSIKFFITGRPEPRIRTGFRLPLLEPITQIFLLHEVELSSVDEDIRLYFQARLTAIAKQRSDLDLPDPWPSNKDLMALTKKSSGLFIFASTLVRFIESGHHMPDERLQLIVTLPDSTVLEGRAGVDSLYAQILEHAFSGIRETAVFANLRRVLGAVILAFNPLSREQIARILRINSSLIPMTLRHLHSVLLVPSANSKEIRIFHKSFSDFLQDSNRCSDSRFFIDSPLYHGDMAFGCLELLKKLKPNSCDLPDFAMNRDVANLSELLEDKLGSAVQYACGYWAMHVQSSPTTNDYAIPLIASVAEFMENNAVPWIEVMSLDNRLESVIQSMFNLLDWISKVDTYTPEIRSLAQDCLRFTMHSFHLIQQSAPHIYHSALPLSPRSSMFRSMAIREKTQITGFHGRPHAWGAVIRTITSGSGRFTCMTTFHHWIAAASDDGTVGVYDSATGALRSSLSPVEPVQAMSGSPDGSLLFCTHNPSSMTQWDVQTGGLIHTHSLKWEVKDIVASPGGNYLACSLSDDSVKIWGVAGGEEGVTIGRGSPVTHPCWLEQEQLAVAEGALVHIWDVHGRVKRTLPMEGAVCGVVYSRKLDKLAIVIPSGVESTVAIIDRQPGTPPTSYKIQRRLSCFAFSQTTEELVCGRETDGLEVLNLSTGHWRHFDHPATVSSVFTLPNGGVVANVVGSGIQSLDLGEGYTPPQQVTVPALTAHSLDEGRIIAVLLTTQDHVVLLEFTTMSQLLTIPIRNTHAIPTNSAPVLCASRENRLAFYCFEEGGKGHLQLWRFGSNLPGWTVEINELPSIGGISPSGARLVAFHDAHHSAHIYVLDTQNGHFQANLLVDQSSPTTPLEIKFESEDQFHSQHNTYRIPYVISSSESGTPSHSITRHEQQPFVGESQRYYEVDDFREWVVGPSKRICFIPPGYIGLSERGHCWIGYTLVMAGQDGVLRKFTFRKPS